MAAAAATSDGGAGAAFLFSDIFEVSKVNPDGKKFERVDRIAAKGTTFEMELLLDIPCEVLSLKEKERFTLSLASTLRLDGKPDSDYYEPDGRPSLLDEFDCGMCGKVFKHEHTKEREVSIIASFGGLLMLLQGEQRHLVRIELDQKVYALIRKVGAASK